jgi:2-dehydro-3-deoxyphosphogluconate aldolase / (4S)-4-hydroxy-2-oxoglutarate aldolase
MGKKADVFQAILQQKLLPLFYHESADVSMEVLRALFDAGIRTIEYTNRGDNALDNFKELKKVAGKSMPGLLLGAGTIKTKNSARNFMDAGADFIVCPSMNEAVAEVVHKEGLLWVPGCLTTTEISFAEETGASLVKIFPGSMLGPSYITAIKEIFPALRFMPTGGVELEETNLKTWFGAGAAAVGIGSKLISKTALENRDYDGIKRNSMQSLVLIKGLCRR